MTREQFIYALTACGCLLKDGKTWYEHNELIKCFEDLGLFEQESILDKIRAEIRKKMKFNSFNEGYVLYDDITEVLDKYKAEQEAENGNITKNS